MKKTTTLLRLALLCAALPAATHAWGRAAAKPTPVTKTALALRQDFPGVAQVSWTRQQGENLASFKLDHARVLAAYDDNGQLMMTRVFSDASRIPFGLRMQLRKAFPGFEPQHMTECIDARKHRYYFLLKKQKKDLVTWLRVQSDPEGRHTAVIQRLHQVVNLGGA